MIGEMLRKYAEVYCQVGLEKEISVHDIIFLTIGGKLQIVIFEL